MHPFLTRLGIRREVQDFFAPYYHNDEYGNLCFSYGDSFETYGMGFHHLPVTSGCWTAATHSPQFTCQLIICRSAMAAIAWLSNGSQLTHSVHLTTFIAVGNQLSNDQLKWIRQTFPRKKYSLLFENDLIGNVCDLKAAAFLSGIPLTLSVSGDQLLIYIRHRTYQMDTVTFSLNAFERVSGYRFGIRTMKPQLHVSWLSLAEAQSFNA